MRILILGGGGREHALGWAIRRGRPDAELVFAPGNGGTELLGSRRALRPAEPEEVLAAAVEIRPDLVVIGPEAPLVAGVADLLRENGFAVFGPSRRAARIEGSKIYAKTLMRDHGIPAAPFETFRKPDQAREYVRRGLFPKVVKADGLAAGKGAIIVRDPEEGERAIAELMESGRFGRAAEQILIEGFLEGEEVSVFALARDEEFVLLPLAQDHKRLGEGDTGPNTGGMGAYAPFPRAGAALIESIETEVIGPTLRALAADGRAFRGLLYAGLMIVYGRPMVLEFNCRFGDPETQALAPLLGSGFAEALCACATGQGPLVPVAPPAGRASGGGEGAPRAAAAVVLASGGYPGAYRTGFAIEGCEKAAELPHTYLFHAGTEREEGGLVTSGGRVLAVTGEGPDLKAALRRAYEGCSLIHFEGRTLRRDIGRRGLASSGEIG